MRLSEAKMAYGLHSALHYAFCPPLDVASQADSSEAALASLQEAVEGWFESCLDRGVLDQALVECGFHRGSITESGTREKPQGDHGTIRCSVPAYVLETLGDLHAPR